MAYPYFPQNYPNYQPMPYLPQMNQNNSHDNEFVHVQHENQAREWSLMPGQSKTFINDNAPYCYTKSMPLSQLEPPVFKRFRLIEEPDSPQNAPELPPNADSIDMSAYVLKSEFEPFCALIEGIKADLEALQRKPKKKEVTESE